MWICINMQKMKLFYLLVLEKNSWFKNPTIWLGERILAYISGIRFFPFVGNKAKGRISKWVFQENKTRQTFRKTNISYPLRVKNIHFPENLVCFVFLKHPFWDLLFAFYISFHFRTNSVEIKDQNFLYIQKNLFLA